MQLAAVPFGNIKSFIDARQIESVTDILLYSKCMYDEAQIAADAELAALMELLGSMTHTICNLNGRKLLVFTDCPTVQLEVEMFLYFLGFKIAGIRAEHKTAERDDIVDGFDDKTSNLQILVTSLRISATALNLQNGCSDVIFIDAPSNAQSALKAGGRELRIGQRRTYYI